MKIIKFGLYYKGITSVEIRASLDISSMLWIERNYDSFSLIR
jgi:hypothetical protein